MSVRSDMSQDGAEYTKNGRQSIAGRLIRDLRQAVERSLELREKSRQLRGESLSDEEKQDVRDRFDLR